MRGKEIRIDRERLVTGVRRLALHRDVEVVTPTMTEEDLVVREFAENRQIGRVLVEVANRPRLVTHVVRHSRHGDRPVQVDARVAQRFHRHDLAHQGCLHVHDPMAIDRAVDDVAGERLRLGPSDRDGLGVHVTGEDHALTGTEPQLAHRVGPVWKHFLQAYGLETRLPHVVREEACQRSFVPEDTRNPANLLNEIRQALVVDRRYGLLSRNVELVGHCRPLRIRARSGNS